MKLIICHSNETQSVIEICFAACRKAAEQVRQTKNNLFREFRARAEERALRLALNEAEALAWQTDYPHLVFPMLALEKAEGLAAWEKRQQDVRRASLRVLAAA